MKQEQERKQVSLVPSMMLNGEGHRALKAMSSLPARRPVLGSVASGVQRRSLTYNAHSPAQRYFVEGDHVIAAELNRTLQFTGLDSGSFYPFVVYTVVATAIASVFMLLPFAVAPTRVDLDKSSAYECGFDAFGDARQSFSVSFYVVSIMYLLFDIELVYLFPYVMTQANEGMFWTMQLFMSFLVVGFIYEWGVGALEWRD
ncbi:MAG: hypothetical protein WDW38_007674 [Sanguina aurantia]